MGGRLCLTLHAAVPAGDWLGGELARWLEAAGGGSASASASGRVAAPPTQGRGLLARGPGGGRRPRLSRPSAPAPPGAVSGAGAASPPAVVRELGGSGRNGRAGGKLPPRWILDAFSSGSPVPKGSLVGHFHPVPRRGAERHLFSISREAEANPGLRAARPSQHSQSPHGS